MAKELAILLEDATPTLLQCFKDLENATGNKGHDTRLIGDVIQKSGQVMKHLGLDPSDTTPEELYNALRVSDYESILSESPYVAVVFGQEMISFNAQDIAYDEKRSARFEYRSRTFYKAELKKEIAQRYKQSIPVKQTLVNRIIKTAFKEEK